MSLFTTFTGREIDFDNFNENDVHLEDIAHHLSRLQRSCGSLPMDISYTVGEHCISLVKHFQKVGKISRLGLRMLLLHDASEAYMADLPSPVKYRLPDYVEMESNIQRTIYKKLLNVDTDVLSDNLKTYDKRIYLDEVASLEPRNYIKVLQGSEYQPLNCRIYHSHHPSTVKQCFLTLAKELGIK